MRTNRIKWKESMSYYSDGFFENKKSEEDVSEIIFIKDTPSDLLKDDTKSPDIVKISDKEYLDPEDELPSLSTNNSDLEKLPYALIANYLEENDDYSANEQHIGNDEFMVYTDISTEDENVISTKTENLSFKNDEFSDDTQSPSFKSDEFSDDTQSPSFKSDEFSDDTQSPSFKSDRFSDDTESPLNILRKIYSLKNKL